MKSSALLVACTLLAGCGGTLVSTTRTSSSAVPDDLFACVQNQLKTMGYNRLQYDALERWYVAQKPDPDTRVPSGLYRGTKNVLDTKVRPDASGSTVLEITAKSFDEYTNARGTDSQERQVTERAKLDAQILQQACAK